MTHFLINRKHLQTEWRESSFPRRASNGRIGRSLTKSIQRLIQMVSFISSKKSLFYVKVIVNLIDRLLFDLYPTWFSTFTPKCILHKIAPLMRLSLIHVTILNLAWYKQIVYSRLFLSSDSSGIIGFVGIFFFAIKILFTTMLSSHFLFAAKNIRGNKALLLLTENKFYIFVGILIFILTINSVFGE